MEELTRILEFIETLQADDSLDLSSYSTEFVDVLEAHQNLTENIEAGQATTEEQQVQIDKLKQENWDLSKKITTPETIDDEDVEEEIEEEEDQEKTFDTTDEAIADLFKDDDEDQERKE